MNHQNSFAVLFALLLLFCGGPSPLADAQTPPTDDADAAGKALETATFAGGCFWCMEAPFETIDGVISAVAGYTGGSKENPTYEEVSAGGTGHAESVEITFDPAKVSYRRLLEVYWRNVDPTAKDRQFCDVGDQYRTAVFYHGDEQHRAVLESKEALEKSASLAAPIVTEIVAAATFYPAEEYHQDYYRKNPLRYQFYRYNCGRDQRLEQLWGSAVGGH